LNFLLHHHLAARDLGRPEAALGAMLPDVWRVADRRARARLRGSEGRGLEPSPIVLSVMEGVAHHVATDAWFHGSSVFARGEVAARDALRRAKRARKMGLFAHVVWELCLDGALLRRIGTEGVLASLRESVATVRPDAHHRAADRCTDIPTPDRARFEARVDQIVDALTHGPWVTGYTTAAGIVDILDRVRARLGFAPVDRSDRAAVEPRIELLQGEADSGLEEILRP
jgi:hypothetical protein